MASQNSEADRDRTSSETPCTSGLISIRKGVIVRVANGEIKVTINQFDFKLYNVGKTLKIPSKDNGKDEL
jgi:hypothetical protein